MHVDAGRNREVKYMSETLQRSITSELEADWNEKKING
jgi:hypothetical protein